MVSIVIPAYNAEPFIEETIKSVQEQTYDDWEIIIVNDGSTDNTESLCEKITKEDTRVYLFNQENKGVSEARNYGILKSRGEFIAFLDADDSWLETNLYVKMNYFKNNPSISWVFSDMYLADENLNIIEEAPKGKGQDILESILLWEGEVVPGPCSNIIIKRECVDEGCLFDPAFSTAADQDYCLQLSSKFKGGYINQVLWKYRYIPISMSRNVQIMEIDHIGVFRKAEKNNLFKSYWFKKKCFSNLYLVLAGSWWVNGGDKLRALWFIFKSLVFYPLNIVKLMAKL